MNDTAPLHYYSKLINGIDRVAGGDRGVPLLLLNSLWQGYNYVA